MHLGLQLRDLVLEVPKAGLHLALVLLELLELLLQRVTVALEFDDLLLGRAGHELRGHQALLDGTATTGHGAGLVNQRAVERDDTPPLSTVGDAVGLG